MNNNEKLVIKSIIDRDLENLEIDDLRELRTYLDQQLLKVLPYRADHHPCLILPLDLFIKDYGRDTGMISKELATLIINGVSRATIKYNPSVKRDIYVFDTLELNEATLTSVRGVGSKIYETYENLLRSVGLSLSIILTDDQIEVLEESISIRKRNR